MKKIAVFCVTVILGFGLVASPAEASPKDSCKDTGWPTKC